MLFIRTIKVYHKKIKMQAKMLARSAIYCFAKGDLSSKICPKDSIYICKYKIK